jgi:hypothetical protein
MSAWMRWLTFGCFAWILWMDQTVYNLPGERKGQTPAPIAAETASGRSVRVGVFATKEACEAARRPQVQEAGKRDADPNRAKGYPERFRLFCTLDVDTPTR